MKGKTQEEIALAIGTLLIGSGFENLLVALTAVKECDFVDTDTNVKKEDVVLGTMSLLEKAAYTYCEKNGEEMLRKVSELKERVCPSCPVDHDCENLNAPCKDLQGQMDLIDQAKALLWDSIRKRFGDLPSVGVRSGFTVVKLPVKEREIGIEVIEVHGMSGLPSFLGPLLAGLHGGKFRHR